MGRLSLPRFQFPGFGNLCALGDLSRSGLVLEGGESFVRCDAISCIHCEGQPLEGLRDVAIDP